MAKIRYGRREEGAAPWAAGMVAGAFASIVGVALGAGLRRRRKAGAGPSTVASSSPSTSPSTSQELAALRAHMAQQAQAARQLDHDLRAPVGAMAVALELMSTTDDQALRQEAMEVLGRQIARMNTLTQQVHEFSREFNG